MTSVGLVSYAERNEERIVMGFLSRLFGRHEDSADFDNQVEKILDQKYTAGPKYTVRCLAFGCPHCGVEITKVPSWPLHGNTVTFYAQEDLYRTGEYYIEMICRGCGKTFYVVWDEDPN